MTPPPRTRPVPLPALPQVTPVEAQLADHDQDHIVQFFRYSHLPARLAEVSEGFAELALVVLETVPRNPERTVALRKLLEAKDAAVRAVVAG